MSLIDHPSGDYRFLPGIAPYSCGVVSKPGFEIVQVTFLQPPEYRAGMRKIEEFLHGIGRPRTALCGVSLRSPRPYTFQGFADFNAEYTSLLQTWGVFVDGLNPIARTNVAPVVGPPAEPVLYGFSITRPCPPELPSTFVVAGAGELPEGVLTRDQIIGLGDLSTNGLETKARFVMNLMEARLLGLGAVWSAVNAVNIYTAHSLTPLLPGTVLQRIGSAAIHGVRWHYARPPIEEIEYEMDVRGVRAELIIT
jgi:hypothetical protein